MTMKRTLLTLVVAILGACMTFVSCTSSEEAPIEFSFPSQITHTMGADESKSISIEPNAMWEISLSKSAAAHFYIADGDQKRQNMRGEAGKFSIEIKTTSTIDFDNDIACQITMTMKDGNRTESKVIADLTKSKAQRVVTLYAAKVDNGSFVEQEGEDGSKTVYNTNAVGSDGVVMVVSKEDIDDIEARFKVAANCAWTMILPEWLEANALTGNASAQKEISLKVKTDLLPEDVYSGEIEFIATENEASIKIVKVSIDSEAIAKKAEIYPAQIADGEYVVKGEGENGSEYLFSEEQVAQAGHSMRVNAANITEIDALFKVVTNFKWNIEAPEWIRPIETQEVGESVVLLEVDYSKLPAQGDVEGELKIIDVAKSKAISTVKLSISAEALTPKVMIYPAKIEDGEFVLPEGESEFAVEYDTNVVGDNGIELIWPIDNAWANARVKVESNLPLNINMPEWMVAASELESGVHELQLRADNTKLPKDAATINVEFMDAGKSDDRVLSTVKLSYAGIDSFFSVTGFEKESLFDVEGMTTREDNPVDHARGAVRATKNGAKVWLVSLKVEGGKYVVDATPEWVTATLSDWDGDDLVQSRNLDVKVVANDGVAREAYLYVLPSSVEVKSADSFFVKQGGVFNGNLEAKYDAYLATTIKQEAAAIVGTDLVSVVNIDESASMSTIKRHWLTYELPSGIKLAEIYNLTYTKSSDNANSLFASSKTIESFAYYCANASQTWVDTDASSSWITTENSGSGFKIKMDTSLDAAQHSKQSDSYVGGILIKFADGTYALIVCTYEVTNVDQEEDEGSLISYKWPENAKEDKSTLVELESGDLYDKYKSYGAPIFHLTYVKKFSTLSALTGIDYNWDVEYLDGCEQWLNYEGGEEFQTIFMNAFGKSNPSMDDPIVNNNVTGVIVFRSDVGVELVLICTLAIPEE